MVRSRIAAILNYWVMRRIQLYRLPMYVESDWSLYTTVRALALLWHLMIAFRVQDPTDPVHSRGSFFIL